MHSTAIDSNFTQPTMNRLVEWFELPDEPERNDDFYEVESHTDYFPISAHTAREIERCLESVPTPRWIVFRDLVGARHRVLVAHISRISESTAAQRAARREFWRARREEKEQDGHPWDD